jgi:hypothetical protein
VRYNLVVAYVLWLFSGFGVLGLHRFYLGKKGTGLLWMFTWGLGTIGAIYDGVTLPRQVEEANLREQLRATLAYGGAGGLPPPYASSQARPERPEKTILRVAKKSGGFVTPGEVALEGDLSVDEARKLLEKLAAAGNAEMRVRSSGVVVYYFPEFAKEGRDDFAV